MRHTAFRRFVAACAAGALVSACCFIHPFYKQEVRPLTYRYHFSIPGHWIPAIDRAANSWNTTTNMFVSGGGGGGATYAPDGINSIFLYSFAHPSILAGVDFPITDFCGLHDTDMGWSTVNPFSTTGAHYDVETVALHEFGHYGILGHVSCPSSAIMYPSYQGIRRNPTGCDRFGMLVSNVLPECFPAMGICRPSFLSFSLFFEDLDEENSTTLQPFQNHRDELIQIWDADTHLRNTSDSVGSFYDSMADGYRNGSATPESEVFTWGRYSELDSQIISRVYQSASYPLRADLDSFRQHLQGKIGMTFGQIFRGETRQYEPSLYDPSYGGGGEDPCLQQESGGPQMELRPECGAQ